MAGIWAMTPVSGGTAVFLSGLRFGSLVNQIIKLAAHTFGIVNPPMAFVTLIVQGKCATFVRHRSLSSHS